MVSGLEAAVPRGGNHCAIVKILMEKGRQWQNGFWIETALPRGGTYDYI